MTKPSTKILYLFKAGRRNKIDTASPPYPTEFFYGYMQMRAAGMDVSFLEEVDLMGSGQPSLAWRALNRLTYGIFGINAWSLKAVLNRSPREKLNGYDVVITTSNTLAVALGVAKRVGLVKPQVISIVMGVITPSMPIWRRWFSLSALKGTRTVAISRGEEAYLNSLSRKAECGYLPFGVDATFWRPATTPQDSGDLGEKYVLSIGNDRFRDYQTLIESWKPHFPLLKIITKLPLNPEVPNIKVIKGDMWEQALTDNEVRSEMRNAQFLVIPILNTIQPSGQSATLQAMACGKTVILSDIEGLWDRDLMVSNDTCILVEPESATALEKACADLLENSNQADEIGANARHIVETHLNTEAMAQALPLFWAS